MRAANFASFLKESGQWRSLSTSLRWAVRPAQSASPAYRGWMSTNTHSHSYTELLLCLTGDHLYGMDGKAQSLSPGEVLIFPPGVRHDSGYSRHHGACTDLWFHFLTPKHVGINIVEHRVGSRILSRRVAFADPAISQDLQRACFLISSHPLPDTPHRGKTGAFVFFLLHEILENLSAHGLCEQSAEVHPVISHIKEYITLNLGDRLILSDLARVAGFSPFHFHREFRRVEKITPREFIETERLKLACKLLERGRSVTSAAIDSGFPTCPHFNRTFKKRFGLAPVAWLKSRRK